MHYIAWTLASFYFFEGRESAREFNKLNQLLTSTVSLTWNKLCEIYLHSSTDAVDKKFCPDKPAFNVIEQQSQNQSYILSIQHGRQSRYIFYRGKTFNLRFMMENVAIHGLNIRSILIKPSIKWQSREYRASLAFLVLDYKT